MGLEVVLLGVFLCMLPLNSGSQCVNYQLRVPTSSINGYFQNLNPGVPYALARNGKNYCKTCKGSICNDNCNSSGQIRFQPPQKAITVSIPSDKSPSGRLTITIDTRSSSPGKEAAPDQPPANNGEAAPDQPPANNGEAAPDQPPANNGETSKEFVNVNIQFVPNNETGEGSSTSTSGKSMAIKDKYGEELAANTNGAIDIPGSNKVLLVSVNVDDDDSGEPPSDMSLTSDITANNGNGEVSKTDTEAAIVVDTPSDGSDSPVTEPAEQGDAPSPGDNENPPPSSEAAADDKTAAADPASGATVDSG